MKIDSRFVVSKVRFDQKNSTNLVLSLTAPKLDWEKKRQPICVVPVIDISPSMEGAKMAYAKQSVLKLIDNLQPGDYCGVIVFSSTAEEIAPIQEMTQQRKDALKAKVSSLRVRSATNISEGMLMALSRLKAADLSSNVVLRAILFTDGQPNHGITDPEGLKKALEANLGNASVSFFGYGDDANQELLADLSVKGKGNYAYVKNPEDALTAFAKELGGLLSTYATELDIVIDALDGHRFTEIVSDVDSESNNEQKVRIKIPDLLSEETRHIVLGVELAEQKSSGPRAVNAIEVNVEFAALNDNNERAKFGTKAKAKVQFVKPGEEQTQPDEALDLIVSTAKLVQTQLEAEKMAKDGNFNGANARWDSLLAYLTSHNHQTHVNAAASFKSKYQSNASYRASSAFLKSASAGLNRSVGYYSSDSEANSVVAGTAFGSKVTNDAQDEMYKSFTGKLDNAAPAQTPDFNGLSNMFNPAASSVKVVTNVTVNTPSVKSNLTKNKSKGW